MVAIHLHILPHTQAMYVGTWPRYEANPHTPLMYMQEHQLRGKDASATQKKRSQESSSRDSCPAYGHDVPSLSGQTCGFALHFLSCLMTSLTHIFILFPCMTNCPFLSLRTKCFGCLTIWTSEEERIQFLLMSLICVRAYACGLVISINLRTHHQVVTVV